MTFENLYNEFRYELEHTFKGDKKAYYEHLKAEEKLYEEMNKSFKEVKPFTTKYIETKQFLLRAMLNDEKQR